MIYFNSQPHEEADRPPGHRRSHPLYFNSQPHEEADEELLDKKDALDISTHSLTKRLTEDAILLLRVEGISTHSLTKRLTQAACTECGLKIISTHSLTTRLTGG